MAKTKAFIYRIVDDMSAVFTAQIPMSRIVWILLRYIYICKVIFSLTHLADAFIQSGLQANISYIKQGIKSSSSAIQDF